MCIYIPECSVLEVLTLQLRDSCSRAALSLVQFPSGSCLQCPQGQAGSQPGYSQPGHTGSLLALWNCWARWNKQHPCVIQRVPNSPAGGRLVVWAVRLVLMVVFSHPGTCSVDLPRWMSIVSKLSHKRKPFPTSWQFLPLSAVTS